MAAIAGLFVCNLVFITRYVRPEGLWRRRAFLNNRFLPRTSPRRHSGASPPSTLHPLKKHKTRRRKGAKEKYILGRTAHPLHSRSRFPAPPRPRAIAQSPSDRTPPPVLERGPDQTSSPPLCPPKLQHHRSRSRVSGVEADGGGPRGLPLTIPLDSLPQSPNLGRPPPTPDKEVMARLSLAAAAPPAPVVGGLADPRKVGAVAA